MKFKDYLSTKRKERGITVRAFAAMVKISPSFLCDLESGNRQFPSNSKVNPNLLNDIIASLNLVGEDAAMMERLANESMLEVDKVSAEVSNYLKTVPQASAALRIAKDKNITQEKWDEIVRILEEA